MAEQIGVIGLAVMGENSVLNLMDHGAPIAVYNHTAERTRRFIEGPAAGPSIRPRRWRNWLVVSNAHGGCS